VVFVGHCLLVAHALAFFHSVQRAVVLVHEVRKHRREEPAVAPIATTLSTGIVPVET